MTYYCILETNARYAECKPYQCSKHQCQVCIDYQAGLTKPAYPMPAIHYEWEISSRGVLLWESGVSEDQYQGPLNTKP